MSNTTDPAPALVRLPSRIAGLDTILCGGFFKGGTYLIEGMAGAGKTILGNQLCFHHVAAGGRALYVTLLAETHSRMMAHLQSLTFVTQEPLGDALYYISGYSILEQEGLDGLVAFLQQETRRHRADLLVIDGIITAEQMAPSIRDWKRFLHNVHASAEILGCTTVMLTQMEESSSLQTIHTMVDGVLTLTKEHADMRTVREIEVRKLRGSPSLEGRHLFAITNDGIVVYPRTEVTVNISQATLPDTLITSEQPPRMAIGISGLDEMLHGGLPSESTTLLLGATGTGKTMLGFHFLLQGAEQGEKGLSFGFQETPAQILSTMDRLGLDVRDAVNSGRIELLWQPPIQDILDVLAERLLTAVRSQGVRRLFIDGIAGFQRTVASSERLDLFFTALFTALRTLHVTTICSVELPDLFSPTVTVPGSVTGTTMLVENILFLRHVELHSQLYRLISIIKMRGSDYNSAIREFRITDHGIEVAKTFDSAEAILTGLAHSPTVPRVSGAFQPDAASGQGEPQ